MASHRFPCKKTAQDPCGVLSIIACMAYLKASILQPFSYTLTAHGWANKHDSILLTHGPERWLVER